MPLGCATLILRELVGVELFGHIGYLLIVGLNDVHESGNLPLIIGLSLAIVLSLGMKLLDKLL